MQLNDNKSGIKDLVDIIILNILINHPPFLHFLEKLKLIDILIFICFINTVIVLFNYYEVGPYA